MNMGFAPVKGKKAPDRGEAPASGIKERLGRLFLLQLAAIGIATLVGIYVTQIIVEDLLTRQALETEAEYFWKLYEADTDVALPDTANLTGFLYPGTGADQAPVALNDLEPGYHEHTVDGRKLLVHISTQQDKTLGLVFEGDQVSDLAFYFGILPLSILLLLMYALLFSIHRWSQRAVSPIVRLAEVVESTDLNRSGQTVLDLEEFRVNTDSEIRAMVDALEHFTNRLDRAVERERNFTRDAGHELRTPVAVLKGSLDLLERQTEPDDPQNKPLTRMRSAVQDMEALLESLLLLAREETAQLPKEKCDVNAILQKQILSVSSLAYKKGIQLRMVEHAQLSVLCPPKLLEVVTSNLVRNAVLYTQEGEVVITVHADEIIIADTGTGMSSEDLSRAFESFYRADDSRGNEKGHGLGLAIVSRIVGLLGWQLRMESELGKGTSARLSMSSDAGQALIR